MKSLEIMTNMKKQFSTKGTAEETGTGLGLGLCKDYVNKNGGRIWVESQLGEGTTFHYTIPRQQPPNEE